MLCDKIFRVVPRDPTPVDINFLAEVLRIGDVRRQVEAKVTGTSPTMKNISKPALMRLAFPLPRKDKQVDMVTALTDARTTAAHLRQQAGGALVEAQKDFEAAVYPAENDPATAAMQPRPDSGAAV